MNNSKRNIHSSGPLGMLVKSGQIKKVDSEPSEEESFQTVDGIKFKKGNLFFVNPEECEPWTYANRLEGEMGNIEELIDSIKENGQLQPALVKEKTGAPKNGIKYEIIFGRRRHIACSKLKIPFLVIRKDGLNVQDAIASQDAENKLRKDVSNYSNAILYKKLIEDKVFSSEKALAHKLMISTSSLNDLMAFTRIPKEIIAEIPDIHTLSSSIALKIVSLLRKSKSNEKILLALAPEIGKKITSPVKLENAVKTFSESKKIMVNSKKTSFFENKEGKRLFSFKKDHKGNFCFLLNKNLDFSITDEELCLKMKAFLENLQAQ